MSTSLPEQADSVAALVARLNLAVPEETPRVVVGGHAVKVRAVTHLAGTDLARLSSAELRPKSISTLTVGAAR